MSSHYSATHVFSGQAISRMETMGDNASYSKNYLYVTGKYVISLHIADNIQFSKMPDYRKIFCLFTGFTESDQGRARTEDCFVILADSCIGNQKINTRNKNSRRVGDAYFSMVKLQLNKRVLS